MKYTQEQREELFTKGRRISDQLGAPFQNPMDVSELHLIDEIDRIKSVRAEFDRQVSDYMETMERLTNHNVNNNPDLGIVDHD